MIDCWTRKYRDSPTFRIGSVAIMPKNTYTARLQAIMSDFKTKEGK